MCTHIYIYARITHMCEHLRIYARIYAYMHAYTHICMHIRIYAQILTYIHAYTHFCNHIRKYTRIYKYISLCSFCFSTDLLGYLSPERADRSCKEVRMPPQVEEAPQQIQFDSRGHPFAEVRAGVGWAKMATEDGTSVERIIFNLKADYRDKSHTYLPLFFLLFPLTC